MKRLTLALVVIAASAFAVVSIAQAKHERHHRNTLSQRLARWEHRFHFKLTKANALLDADADGVSNVQEFVNGTNPLVKDTDHNGVPDGRGDHNHNGIPNDMDSAATVKSFTPATATTPAVLVIALPDGTTETGDVTDQTRIECEQMAPPVATTPTTPTMPTTPTTPTAPAPATERDHGDGNDNDNGDDNDNRGNDGHHGDNSGPGSDNSGPGSNSSGPGPGDDNDNDNDGNDDNEMCTTAALTVGATVHSAELKITSAGPVFKELELITP